MKECCKIISVNPLFTLMLMNGFISYLPLAQLVFFFSFLGILVLMHPTILKKINLSGQLYKKKQKIKWCALFLYLYLFYFRTYYLFILNHAFVFGCIPTPFLLYVTHIIVFYKKKNKKLSKLFKYSLT